MWCMYTKVLSTAHSPLRPRQSLKEMEKQREYSVLGGTPGQQRGGPFSWKHWSHQERATGGEQMDDHLLSSSELCQGKVLSQNQLAHSITFMQTSHTFVLLTPTGLESTQRYCSTEGSWGKPYLVFCPQVLHIKITKPLESTSLFLMNAKAMMEVAQNERTDRVAQKSLLKCTAPWERLCSQSLQDWKM